ncbi:MAG TPA: hypothetical protein VGH44_05175 [Candidatus Saccharimonadia bacterium]
MKFANSRSGKKPQRRGTERLNSSPRGGRQPARTGGMADQFSAAHTGFAPHVSTTSPSRPQPGFAAAMARGQRGSASEPVIGRSRVLDDVLNTGKLNLRDGH